MLKLSKSPQNSKRSKATFQSRSLSTLSASNNTSINTATTTPSASTSPTQHPVISQSSRTYSTFKNQSPRNFKSSTRSKPLKKSLLTHSSSKNQLRKAQRVQQPTITYHKPLPTITLSPMDLLAAQITPQLEPVDWDYTDPKTGTLAHPDYPNVLFNPSLLLTEEQKQAHYEKAWKLYNETMHKPESICAPMVEQSELPFRLLSRKYDVPQTYTPMINSNPSFKLTLNGLDRVFETTELEKGSLTIQICGANIQGLFNLGEKLIEKTENVTDFNLNLGCPQAIAKRGRYGSFLLEETIHVQRIVRSLYDILPVPVTVKMRKLLNDDENYTRTLAYARVLQDSGASTITLHGRTRNNKQDKIGQVDLQALKMMKQNLKIPFFANGGVGSYFDAKRIQNLTQCDAVMLSESLLGFPTMMSFPIRRSQLLGHNDRSICEEGFYKGVTDVETIEQRKHYSYPQFDDEIHKDTVFDSLPSHFRALPSLQPRSSCQELQYIDQFCGPDPIQVASELIFLTHQHSHHWFPTLRPHVFKILHRELSCHTDLRMVYSMAVPNPRMDIDLLQILRFRDFYVWNKYKSHVISNLYTKLQKDPNMVKIEDLDTSSLSDSELEDLLRDFDFKAITEHLDTYPWFSAELDVRKMALKAEEEQQIANEQNGVVNEVGTCDNDVEKQPQDQQTSDKMDSTTQSMVKIENVVKMEEERKYHNVPNQRNPANKERFQGRMNKEQAQQQQRELAKQQQQQQNQHKEEKSDDQQCADDNEEKCGENKIPQQNTSNDDTTTQTQTNQQSNNGNNQKKEKKKDFPQLLPTHSFPAHTNPCITDPTQRLLNFVETSNKKGKKQISLSHQFSREHWHEVYRKFCLEHNFLQSTGNYADIELINPFSGEKYTQNREMFHQTEHGYNANLLIPNPTSPPTTADIINQNNWTSRAVQDKQWIRLFRLDRPDSTISLPIQSNQSQNDIENMNDSTTPSNLSPTSTCQHQKPPRFSTFSSTPLIKTPQYPGLEHTSPLALDHYILPLPLESSWFFEKIFALHKHWYYRYDHTHEVLHLKVDADSIQDQLKSMRDSRKQKIDNIQMCNERAGPDNEERFRNKQAKLKRKDEQRLANQEFERKKMNGQVGDENNSASNTHTAGGDDEQNTNELTMQEKIENKRQQRNQQKDIEFKQQLQQQDESNDLQPSISTVTGTIRTNPPPSTPTLTGKSHEQDQTDENAGETETNSQIKRQRQQ